ncbi:hypothetical protein BV898_14973 [Hypsibius exemplaris]|uniref:G-protein coupled receptors family 1 profile domain-containing protein n=1 Tax=Hypsibius exemplaris TaxID=2072580 RepID=A0A9X6NBN6_HYPEX|nr:hypothetical protein BV898_14973 [Hypsibius exemplaris]
MSLGGSFNISSTNVTLTILPANCTLNAAQRYSLTVVPLLINAAIVTCQLFNILVFHRWPDKQPFLRYHVSLAAWSLVYAVTGSAVQIVRLIHPWTEISVIIARAASICATFCSRIVQVNILLISLDRWLSVELAIWYRNTMTQRKAWMIVVLSVVIGVLLFFPVLTGSGAMRVTCNEPLTGTAALWLPQTLAVIGLVAIAQTRILTLAVELKLRQLLYQSVRPAAINNRPAQSIPQRHSKLILGLTWHSLAAASVVVVMALACQFLPILVLLRVIDRPSLMVIQVTNYTSAMQHIYTLFVYFAFYPDFRTAARDLFSCCHGGRRGHRSLIQPMPKIFISAPVAPAFDRQIHVGSNA